MERLEAQILFKNLLRRIKPVEADQYELNGVITDGELQALHIALASLDGNVAEQSPSVVRPSASSPIEPVPPADGMEYVAECQVELNLSIFDLPAPSANERICLDFGTAMSKATLVINDAEDEDIEEIHVLELGIPTDQREVSDTMLISSLYIDNEGLIWFGKNAVDRSLVEGAKGERMRVDNVKRYLSEGAMQTVVPDIYNPSGKKLTGGDLLLAYLMFMTWAANVDASKHGIQRNVQRRFAMPCFSNPQGREVERELRRLLGEAQILADTFSYSLHEGLPVDKFTQAMNQLRAAPRKFEFVTDALTEPLGVANALISKDSDMRRIVLIVDVGAGTSDVGLYRLHVNSESGIRQALEAKGAARGIPLAGNHLDRVLAELIISKAGITPENTRNVSIRSNLALNIRDYKENLFNNETLTVRLLDSQVVDIDIHEFYDLDAVKLFQTELRQCLVETLQSVDDSWLGAASNEGLAVILTGGGARLSMVQALTSGQLEVRGKTIQLMRSTAFPEWLKVEYPALEEDFSRVAVSLGGGRLGLITHHVAQVTAGDVITKLKLDRY